MDADFHFDSISRIEMDAVFRFNFTTAIQKDVPNICIPFLDAEKTLAFVCIP